jgi:hypothetical protein
MLESSSLTPCFLEIVLALKADPSRSAVEKDFDVVDLARCPFAYPTLESPKKYIER